MRKFLVVLLMFASVLAFAQQHSVNGTVKDQNGQPVVGLTVLEQGTKNGVITDVDGRYDIRVSSWIHPEGVRGVLPEEQHSRGSMEPVGKRQCFG